MSMTVEGRFISLIGKNETDIINFHNDKKLIIGGIMVWSPQKHWRPRWVFCKMKLVDEKSLPNNNERILIITTIITPLPNVGEMWLEANNQKKCVYKARLTLW